MLDFDGYIFDLDGTIYLGERLLPGAKEVVQRLRMMGRGVVFISNKPLERRTAYAAKLTRLGIPTEPSEVINSSLVMARYLKNRWPDARLFVIGEPPLVEELEEAGFTISEEPSDIDVVVAAFDRTFDYRKLNIAYQAIVRGAHFVATNADRTCPVEGGEIPDCAAVIGAMEGCTGVKVEAVVGKPSLFILETALAQLGISADRCLMTGDRLATDIRMGVEAGMHTALVLTGVTKREDLIRSEIQPDYVLENVGGILRRDNS